MQHLPFPVSAQADEAEINKLAKDPIWAPYKEEWIASYRAYRENAGNPFLVTPQVINADVSARRYSLYDTRKGSGELRRMRQKEGLKSCPVCGSPVTGDLDHYLPRTSYPEFSIMRANLIPACTHCNSGGKRDTVHGDDPRRFIHPYFDDWANSEIWYVEIVPPFEAARFVPRALSELVSPRKEIVTFHLNNVLSAQFRLSMANEWSSLPEQIRIRVKTRSIELSIDSVADQIGQEIIIRSVSSGVNSWHTALLRGIQQNPSAIKYLCDKAIGVEI